MSIPYSTKVNERTIGQSITNETHVVGIVGVSTYTSSTIRLVEVPQGPGPAVTIDGTGGPYNEILTGTPTGGEYIVDYDTGAITFSISQNGNTVYASYTGTGSEISAEDVNELQAPVSSLLTLDLTYNPPYTSASATWVLNTGLLVTSLNGLTDNITLAAGANVTITPSGQTLIISSTGGGGGSGMVTPFTVTTNTSLTTTDKNQYILVDVTSQSVVLTLPTASGNNGQRYEVKRVNSSVNPQLNSNTVTLMPQGSQTIDGASSYVIATYNEGARLFSDGSNWQFETKNTQTKIWTGSQAEYNAITTPDPNTVYFIM